MHDFLVFTHEFVAILRKVPKEEHTKFDLKVHSSRISYDFIQRRIPTCPIDRNLAIMGTIWTFKPDSREPMSKLVVSKIVNHYLANGAPG